jgi:DNA-binding NtrC family response regulator
MMTKVLVVDDEMGIRNLLTVFLSGLDFYVLTASNGFEAWEKILIDSPDLVISDLKMPIMGGVDLLERISVMDKFIPVIIMTGKPEISLGEVEALQGKASFKGLLEKPFLFEELKEKIEVILKF